jgi:hypothetical protein
MKKIYFSLFLQKNLKFAILLLLIFTVSCNHRPATSKKANADSLTQVDSAASHPSKIPSWLIGTWKGQFSEDQYAMNIRFVVVIKADGTITQTSIVPDEENEVLTGKCDSVNADNMFVSFNEEDDNTIYYLDKRSNKLGISGNNWLTKQ